MITTEEQATGTALMGLLNQAQDMGLYLDLGALIARARVAAYLRITTEPDEDSVLPNEEGW